MLKVNVEHYLILIYSFKIFNINAIIKGKSWHRKSD